MNGFFAYGIPPQKQPGNAPKTKALLAVPMAVFLAVLVFQGCSRPRKKPDSVSGPVSQTGDSRNWPEYGGRPDQSKFVELTQITKENVSQLQVAWHYPTADKVEYLFNPIIVDNMMYVLAKNNSLVALDAATGQERWIHANLNGITWRGINYWESKDRKDRRLLFCLNNTLQAIDAQTGKSILTFGNNGSVSLREGLDRDPATLGRVQSTTPGRIFENLILLGSSPGENLFSAPGHLRAFDVITGKQVWIFHTIPHPGEFGYDTWPKEAYKYVGGANTWGEISLDEKRGIAYFPVGSPTYDYYGADRAGTNLFGNCLLALDARTGKRLWHFQTVHHDLWDYDLTAAPQLITVKHNGKPIDAVAIATKQGFLFAFNRVTGEPLWPIEERPVPASDMPEEKSWPTQPFPTVLPPFNRQNVTANDLNPYMTAEEQASWKKRIAEAKTGLFTPLSDQHETIAMPGAVGGANFGNTAANPSKGLVYVAAQEYPSVYRLSKTELGQAPLSADQVTRAKTTYSTYCQSCHGADRAGIVGPSLVDIGTRVNFDGFKTVVAVGKGQMPGFQHIDEQTLSALYRFLGGTVESANRRPQGGPGGTTTMPTGPVVASGGAPGVASGMAAMRSVNALRAYPEGIPSPANKYTTGYGLEYSNLLSPPWSFIVAYDLNTGTIQWKKIIGQDIRVLKQGGKDTGTPIGSQRKGMIVTANGLLFATSKGGKIYAFDADNGTTLWTAELPKETQGLLSMYEAKGRQYLVVSSTANLTVESVEKGDNTVRANGLPPGYVVFALPEKK
ncbi:PQQ-binding-like beta-propeller repeat protein [Larkinella sp. VNQ87]|uniref:outer membrane protein assembly factor BamB family protein n=1 Tax=Larkinella sp. VNQ87 TaxID=3400921 RepID=UPI003C068ADF